jgi:hypothetical protein
VVKLAIIAFRRLRLRESILYRITEQSKVMARSGGKLESRTRLIFQPVVVSGDSSVRDAH